jgi:hypothetical protein
MNDTSTCQRLTEAELDEAILRTQECNHACRQGRNHACPMPEVEWPPLTIGNFAIAVALIAVVVYISLMVQA